MANKSDKPFVLRLLGGCLLALFIFHIGWPYQFSKNLHNGVFTIGYGIMWGVFIAEAIGALKYSEDPNKDWKRIFLVLLTLAMLLWIGLWAAGVNEDKMFQDDVDKAKQEQP